jgi:hypothetical protein|tara:strand:- start:373 stop:579 length:207 start_codon:yes stop_codon:yes gene_type:complete
MLKNAKTKVAVLCKKGIVKTTTSIIRVPKEEIFHLKNYTQTMVTIVQMHLVRTLGTKMVGGTKGLPAV